MLQTGSESPPPPYLSIARVAIGLPPPYLPSGDSETMVCHGSDPNCRDATTLLSSLSLPSKLFRGLAPVQPRPPVTYRRASIDLLVNRSADAESVKTTIAKWKRELQHPLTGDSGWTSFKLVRIEHRKRHILSYQHEFLLMRFSSVMDGTESAVDLLVERDIVGDTKILGTGTPNDTITILSQEDLWLLQSSILVKTLSWAEPSPSFADVIIVLNAFIESFSVYTITVYNCYHLCAVTCSVLSDFERGILPAKTAGKPKGRKAFWMKVVPDSIIMRDCRVVMDRVWEHRLKDSEERVKTTEDKGKARARQEGY